MDRVALAEFEKQWRQQWTGVRYNGTWWVLVECPARRRLVWVPDTAAGWWAAPWWALVWLLSFGFQGWLPWEWEVDVERCEHGLPIDARPYCAECWPRTAANCPELFTRRPLPPLNRFTR